MKIEKNPSLGLPQKMARPVQAAGSASFKTQFTQALNASVRNRLPSAPITTTRSAAILATGNGCAAQGATHHIENLLNALDTYQKRLGDGRFNLKSLSQDIDRVDAHCRRLAPLAKDPRIDEDLRALLTEGLTTARVEMERFHRGDYC